jgi:SAM-dependent MidA family methyltransferase
MTTLSEPSATAQKHSEQLSLLIQERIALAGGWLDFSSFMQLALYAPGLGYYSAGRQKFSQMQKDGGDFVTAPEMTSLFGRTIAQQVAQIFQAMRGDLLELGAGTGKLAADLLLALADLDCLPQQYLILEVSDHLRQVQLETLQATLPADLLQRVQWLNALPAAFEGVILANEVLDAVPVHLVHATEQGLLERGVAWRDGLVWQDKAIAETHLLGLAEQQNLPSGYLTEFSPAATALVSSLAISLQRGAIILIDYGFSAREYYHPQRNQGTLMCHYQHHAHPDPLVNIGLQDITAHVDFSSVAYAGVNHGLSLAGFCSQAQFLMNAGMLKLMAQVSPDDVSRYAPLAAAAQKLLSPAEMGDIFKVMALTKNLDTALIGFSQGDKSHTL